MMFSESIETTVTPEAKAMFDRYCHSEGITPAEAARDAIRHLLVRKAVA